MTAATRLVVFDCDGTLVDSQHNIVAAMQAAFVGHGLGVPAPWSIRRTVGLPLVEAVTRLLPLDRQEEVQLLAEPVALAYRDAALGLRESGAHDEPLFAGARETLVRLRDAGAVLGVATGKSRRGLERTLAHHGLTDLFVTLKTADDGPGKPDPHILLQAIVEAGATPATTVMVGDTTFDILMAVRAKALSVGVSWGYHEHDELTAAGASRMAAAYLDLPDIIAELFGASQ